MAETPTLKPCPFCGDAPVCEGGPADDCGFWVECRGCKVEQMTLHKTADSAIAAWNQRHGRAALRAALEALANAADRVGVRFFDTDTMEPEVEAMQAATLAARRALEES